MLYYILKAQYEIWGLTAPIFAWCAAVVLLTVPLFAILYLYRMIRAEVSILTDTTDAIQRLKIQRTAVPERGLSASEYKSLAQVVAKQTSLNAAWHSYNSLLVRLRSKSGEEEYWVTDSAESAFGEKDLFASRINRPFFVAMPGIVTGTGLLFTFLAILVALLDIRIDTNNQVQGLELLIGGLSGKFVSSIAALFSATVFLVVEKPLFHRLTKARLLLVRTIDEIMPRVTSVGILADLQQSVSRQTNVFEIFNAELAQKLKRSYGESFVPDVQRTAESSERLVELLTEVELRNQENVKELLRSVLTEMQISISSSLENMVLSFKEGLSQASKDEFGTVSKSLVDSAQLLDCMNTQFQTAQSTFNNMLETVRSTTAEQLELGKQQVEDLNAVLRQFMAQMNESAGTSVNQITGALTDVLKNLSVHVGELEQKMAASVQQNAEKSASTANDVMKQAGTWFDRSTSQLDKLMKQSENQAKTMKDMESTFGSVLQQFMLQAKESTGASLNQITSALTDVLKNLSAHVGELEQRMAASMQQNIEKSTSAANVIVEHASTLSARNAEQLNQLMMQNQNQAKYVKDVESTLGSVLQQFMLQMKESTGASLNQISDTLNGVLLELSTHVSELQEKMAESMQQNIEKASGAANIVMKQVGTWSAESAQQLDQIIKQYEGQTKQMKDVVESTLVSILDTINTSMEHHAALNADWSKIASDMSATVATSADATHSIQHAQKSIEQVAKLTALQLEQANKTQKEVWTWIHNNIVEYQDIFGITENRARDVLTKMTQNLGSYIESNKQGYERLINQADGQLKFATQRLGASVQDLALFLQTLTDTFRKAQRSMNEYRS